MMKKTILYKIKNKKGSNSLEYLIFLAAIISVVIVFLRPGGPMNKTVVMSYNSATDGMSVMSSRLSGSRGGGEQVVSYSLSSSSSVFIPVAVGGGGIGISATGLGLP